MKRSTRPVASVSTTELYNRWAKYYDVDGNILQAVDDHEVPKLLIRFFDLLPQNGKIKITELGCGTGRNTAKILVPPFVGRIQEVHGLDLSDEMLRIARKRCNELQAASSNGSNQVRTVFHVFDALQNASPADNARGADGVISTLVLEHLPIDTFFETVKKLLGESGYLLVTNMHDDMGNRSQAGFLDVDTGEKIRGESYVYSIEDMITEAEKQGFRLEGHFKERGIDEADLDLLGSRGRKWLGCKVWFGCILKYNGNS